MVCLSEQATRGGSNPNVVSKVIPWFPLDLLDGKATIFSIDSITSTTNTASRGHHAAEKPLVASSESEHEDEWQD